MTSLVLGRAFAVTVTNVCKFNRITKKTEPGCDAVKEYKIGTSSLELSWKRENSSWVDLACLLRYSKSAKSEFIYLKGIFAAFGRQREAEGRDDGGENSC